MGSRPSKKTMAEDTAPRKELSRSAAVNNPTGNAYNDTVSAIHEAKNDVTDFTQTIANVKAAMKVLTESETMDDEMTATSLNDLIKIFYAFARTDLKKLFDVCDIMLQHGLLKYFVRMWDTFHEDSAGFYGDVLATKFNNYTRLKIIFWNFSDKCVNLCKACYTSAEVIERLMREFTLPELAVERLSEQRHRHVMKANLGILHNCVRHCDKIRELIRKDDGIDKILEYNKSKYLIIKAKISIVIAYCINEDENEKIMAGTGVIGFIVKLLTSALESPNHLAKVYAFSAEETVAALNKLASNDDNKKKIVEAGILPLLNELLDVESCSGEEHLQAVNCIWSLAFHPDNKDDIINEPGLIDAVKALRSSEKSTLRLKKACSSALFVLNLEQASVEDQGGKQLVSKHIMISYNWEVQPIMFQLRDFLKDKGFDVWMDVDRIQDSILSAMADAVENAAVVVIAMTEAYKNSNSCRTEAEYTYKRGVPILPLLLQTGYVANGWLGAMVGTKLYVDISIEYNEVKFDDIRHQLTSLAAAHSDVEKSIVPVSSQSTLEPAANFKHVQPVYSHPSSMGRFTSVDHGGLSIVQATISCSHWSQDQVSKWCGDIGLKGNGIFLKDLEGADLAQLCKVFLRSPDTYYKLIREDLGLEFKDLLAFTRAVEGLLSS